MKKALTFIIIIAVFMVMSSAAFAGEGCSASKKSATKISSETSGKACSPDEIAACAKTLNISKEECAKLCGEGKITKQTMSIEGMTCAGCENSLTTALEELDGVIHVMSISHKDGSAVVCIDNSKVEPKSLVKAVTSKGYKAEIVLAVAKTTSASGPHMKSCSKTCTPKEKAA